LPGAAARLRCYGVHRPSGWTPNVGPGQEQMTEFLQHMINMLILGSTYALLGIGLTLIFGIMRIVNFAHGELYAFGAYFVYFAAVLLGFNFFVSVLIAIVADASSVHSSRSCCCARCAAPISTPPC
jgi:branched-subunit amino acid ABC-type transport system permease component